MKSQNETKFNLKNKILIVTTFLISVLLITAYLVVKKFPQSAKTSTGVNNTPIADNKTQTVAGHTLYNNDAFNYSVDYPQSLTVRELGSGGGYIDFVRFEEDNSGTYKGFAIGVSEQGFNDEIDRIKKIFKEDDNAFLAEEKAVDYNGIRTRRLYYKPVNTDNGEEERVVVIFNDGGYTYSISSVPYEIDDVLSRFSFIN